MEQRVSLFWGQRTGKAQESEACSGIFSGGNLPICSESWHIQLQKADGFTWGSYASMWNVAGNRESSGDFRRLILRREGADPGADTSRCTGCSMVPSALPGRWWVPVDTRHHFPCIVLPVVTTAPNGILFSLFIHKERNSRCCYSTTSLPSVQLIANAGEYFRHLSKLINILQFGTQSA